MLVPLPPAMCEHARKAASLRLDGELSEVSSARLEAHLRECDACAAYAGELAVIAARMRSTPLEQPRSGMEVTVRRRRSALRPLAFAAAAVAAVASALALGHAVTSPGGGARTSTEAVTAPSLEQEIVSQHILAMERRLAPVASRRIGRVTVL